MLQDGKFRLNGAALYPVVDQHAIKIRPVILPAVEPMRLARLREPFSDPDWIFELKHDGFRSLAYVEDGICRLVSRNGNTFASFVALGSPSPIRSSINLFCSTECTGPETRASCSNPSTTSM
jgi:hypothetical protein